MHKHPSWFWSGGGNWSFFLILSVTRLANGSGLLASVKGEIQKSSALSPWLGRINGCPGEDFWFRIFFNKQIALFLTRIQHYGYSACPSACLVGNGARSFCHRDVLQSSIKRTCPESSTWEVQWWYSVPSGELCFYQLRPWLVTLGYTLQNSFYSCFDCF